MQLCPSLRLLILLYQPFPLSHTSPPTSYSPTIAIPKDESVGVERVWTWWGGRSHGGHVSWVGTSITGVMDQRGLKGPVNMVGTLGISWGTDIMGWGSYGTDGVQIIRRYSKGSWSPVDNVGSGGW
eukprot:766683-Hanusia_phi.AAC.12